MARRPACSPCSRTATARRTGCVSIASPSALEHWTLPLFCSTCHSRPAHAGFAPSWTAAVAFINPKECYAANHSLFLEQQTVSGQLAGRPGLDPLGASPQCCTAQGSQALVALRASVLFHAAVFVGHFDCGGELAVFQQLAPGNPDQFYLRLAFQLLHGYHDAVARCVQHPRDPF